MKKYLDLPFFLLLLPAFYFLNRLNVYYHADLLPDFWYCTGLYAGIALLLTGLARIFVRDWRNASLFAGALLLVQFFFGPFHEWLKGFAGSTFLVKYLFIGPALLLVFILVAIYLRKKGPLTNGVRYTNLLFALLLVPELITLSGRIRESRKQAGTDASPVFQSCDTCARPDIYLLVADEYAGKQALKDIFSFDNTPFEDSLRSRGFTVPEDPHSNYNATIYSLASLFQMDYIPALSHARIHHRDMLRCRAILKNNSLLRFLKGLGYDVENISFLEPGDKPPVHEDSFFPEKRALLTFQLFTSRVKRHLGYHFLSAKKIEAILRNSQTYNALADSLTRQVPLRKAGQPRFVYTHFFLPHHPYYYDRLGREVPLDSLKQVDSWKMNKRAYVEYLQYTNNRFLSLVDHILSHSARPPVIILLGDHGFRQYEKEVKQDYWFMNLAAVYLPSRNYGGFRKGMSNLNIMRQVLNGQFGQSLPLLKDSTVFLPE